MRRAGVEIPLPGEHWHSTRVRPGVRGGAATSSRTLREHRTLWALRWLGPRAVGPRRSPPRLRDEARGVPNRPRQLGRAGRGAWDRNRRYAARALAAPMRWREPRNPGAGEGLPTCPARPKLECPGRHAATATASA